MTDTEIPDDTSDIEKTLSTAVDALRDAKSASTYADEAIKEYRQARDDLVQYAVGSGQANSLLTKARPLIKHYLAGAGAGGGLLALLEGGGVTGIIDGLRAILGGG